MVEREKLEGFLKESDYFFEEEFDSLNKLDSKIPYIHSNELYNTLLQNYSLYSEKLGDSITSIKDDKFTLFCIETYPISRLKSLKSYLEDLIIQLESVSVKAVDSDIYDIVNIQKDSSNDMLTHVEAPLDSNITVKYNSYLNAINHILNLNSKKDILYEKNYSDYSNIHISRVMAYQYNYDNDIGRLYSQRTSMQFFSREIRYILFNDYYTDVDLINAHPTILLEYAQRRNIRCDTLKNYVDHRDDFIYTVSKEVSSEDKLTDAKIIILSTLNKIKCDTKSNLLKKLHSDVINIRESIWEQHFRRVNEKPFLDELLKKEDFNKKNLGKQKVTVQSLYCHSKESEILINLHKFIDTELINKVKIGVKDTDNLTKKVDFRFIPFFDGAYLNIRFPPSTDIPTLIKLFNDTQPLFKFKIKPIEPNFTVLKKCLFNKYELITNFLSKLTHKEYLSLLHVLGYDKFELSEETKAMLIKDFNDHFDKQGKLEIHMLELLKSKKVLRKELKTWAKLNNIDYDNLKNYNSIDEKIISGLNIKQSNHLKNLITNFKKIDLYISETTFERKVEYNYECLNKECRLYEYGLRRKLLPYASSVYTLKDLKTKL